MEDQFDYIVVGAGSAGCVLANRLSADGSTRVLLLEAGGDDRPLHNIGQFSSNINIHLPAGFTRTLNDSKVNWKYCTEPDAGTNGRVHFFPRGKVLGGSSSINGMLYVRGLPEDYDGWRQQGCAGWAWSDVEPLFRRIENHGDATDASRGGPLDVGVVPFQHSALDALTQAFIEAGVKESENPDGLTREGVTRIRTNIKRGARRSSAAAYLHPVAKRRNLRVETRALAASILFDGKRAIGISYIQDGMVRTARARGEVILSGGAINTPQILELSGIGQAGRLRALGIEPVLDSPRVGENLQDHFIVAARARLKPGSPSFNALSHGLNFAGQVLRYAFNRTGLLALGGATISAFLKSDPALDLPDLQFFANPATVDVEAYRKTGIMTLDADPGITIGGYLLKPQSRGSVHIGSAAPDAHPAIAPHFLEQPADQQGAIAVLKWVRRVMRQPALSHHIERELMPGDAAETDDALLRYAREAGVTAYHPVGSCAMGADGGAVVDPRLRVNGVEGLRVADASVMPSIVSGNTHAATVMIAEKASDMIREDAR